MSKNGYFLTAYTDLQDQLREAFFGLGAKPAQVHLTKGPNRQNRTTLSLTIEGTEAVSNALQSEYHYFLAGVETAKALMIKNDIDATSVDIMAPIPAVVDENAPDPTRMTLEQVMAALNSNSKTSNRRSLANRATAPAMKQVQKKRKHGYVRSKFVRRSLLRRQNQA